MNKYIVAFDIETTGLSPVEDYIIELGMVKFDPNDFNIIDSKKYYIEPVHAYEINQSALKTHGITKEFLKANGVSLKSIAQEILDFVSDSDYLTYNGNNFDVKFIYKDLLTIGYEFPIKGKIFYDAFMMYKHYHPCTLIAVYNRYTGKDLENAHDALADVNATIEVFKAIKEEQNVELSEWAELKENRMISPEGSIRNASNSDNPDDHIVFAQGKYKDMEFCEVMRKDPGYIKWFGENVASEYTKKVLNEYWKKYSKYK